MLVSFGLGSKLQNSIAELIRRALRWPKGICFVWCLASILDLQLFWNDDFLELVAGVFAYDLSLRYGYFVQGKLQRPPEHAESGWRIKKENGFSSTFKESLSR